MRLRKNYRVVCRSAGGATFQSGMYYYEDVAREAAQAERAAGNEAWVERWIANGWAPLP